MILNYMATFLVGAYVGVISVIYAKNRMVVKYQKEVERMFSLVLSEFTRMDFIKRINKYAYFKFNEWEIVYQLDNKSLHIFSQESCLATSMQLNDKKTIDELLSKIEDEWGEDINNTVTIDNNEISVNFIQSQMQQNFSDPIIEGIKIEMDKIHYTIDDILDRINQVGYKNLTDDEKDFLKNASK